jgi:hypothetical protein
VTATPANGAAVGSGAPGVVPSSDGKVGRAAAGSGVAGSTVGVTGSAAVGTGCWPRQG